jgi:hypothetical protein
MHAVAAVVITGMAFARHGARKISHSLPLLVSAHWECYNFPMEKEADYGERKEGS